jgi:mRNA interferase RelE/StbE
MAAPCGKRRENAPWPTASARPPPCNATATCSTRRQIAKLDRTWQAAILDHLKDRIAPLDDPRRYGKPLIGDRKGLWRYRAGDYRIPRELRDAELVVLVVTIGHRSAIYRNA